MTAYKLFWLCLKTILRGKGACAVLFDTEARQFEYHLAKIGKGYYEKHGWPEPQIILYEEYIHDENA